MKKINLIVLGISALITLSSCTSEKSISNERKAIGNKIINSYSTQESYIKPGQKEIYDALYTHQMHREDMHDYYHNHINEDMMDNFNHRDMHNDMMDNHNHRNMHEEMMEDYEIVDFMDPNFDMSKIESKSCCEE